MSNSTVVGTVYRACFKEPVAEDDCAIPVPVRARHHCPTPDLASVHKAAVGLHRIGLVEMLTMRKFYALCLTPVEPMAPEEIRALRARENFSQPVFAHYLNVRKVAVGKWERGPKRPAGPLKLLNLVKVKGVDCR
jgi:putative transcriptional regulator